MLTSSIELRSGAGRTRSVCFRQCSGLQAGRPARLPRLGVSAFKDWFNGFVQQQKDAPPQPQPASQAAVLEPPAPPGHQPPSPAAQKPAPKRDFLEARQVSLFQLFDSSDFKFDIPTYQRPYAWGTKQIYELLQDFVKAYESRQEYFLGAIVATRAADGSNVPYQLIDGQQRLTSLVLLLAYLHGWARQQGNEGLEGRIRRMLYLDADPLEPGSSSRYRLRLRDADDGFLRQNVLDEFLPYKYRLAGLAATAAAAAAADGAGDDGIAAGADADAAGLAGQPLEDALPLENEAWWRLYDNASFLQAQLGKLVSEGLNLQDFTFHVLRNCFVVMMVARDESASFRIFSTLNGRGMDLSVVDKLKADLLAGELSPAERAHFADAWAEMEAVLGRAAFHRVFDYMRELAAVRDPRVRETSVLEYFTRRVDDPSAVKQILQVALDYARLLLQLRQASWAPPELAALLSTAPPPSHSQQTGTDTARSEAVSAVVHAVLFEQAAATAAEPSAPVLSPDVEGQLLDQLHEQHRQWQDEVAAPPPPPAAAASASGVTAVEDVSTEAVAPTSTTSLPLVQEDKDGAVLVFRFDDAPNPAAAASPDVAAADAAALQQPPAAVAEEGNGVLTSAAAEIPGGDMSAAAAEAAAEVEAGQVLAEATAAVVLGVAEGQLVECVAVSAETEQQLAAQGGELTVAATAAAPEPVATVELSAAGQETLQPEQQQLPSEQLLEPLAVPSMVIGAQSLPLVQLQLDQPQEATAAEATPSVTVVEQTVMAEAVVEAAPEDEDEDEDPVAKERRRQAALLAELDARSRHLNLFSDEAWVPPLLEFFYQTEDLEHRVAFMKGAETLQLLLELQGDPAGKAARWAQVSDALLQRPFTPERVLEALRLSEGEREVFRARLDSKDLYGTADHRTLRHLLIRCEPPSVSRSLAGLAGLIVERVMPQSAPEGSTWRKTRISSPCDPQSAWPEPWYSAAPTATATDPAAVSEQPQQQPAEAVAAVPVSYEVKYWYEVQRLNWHGKLGNLVLLPATAASAASATADYDAKAALWRQAGVASRLPGFTGSVVDERGRYGRFKFCYDEARQRHADMLEYLTAEFEL